MVYNITIPSRPSTSLWKTTTASYPYHNIVKLSDDEYAIELALAGFKKDDISIEFDRRGNRLSVSGNMTSRHGSEAYLEKYIAERAFSQVFTLARDMVVGEANMEDGILTIKLKHVIPEEEKPVKISVK